MEYFGLGDLHRHTFSLAPLPESEAKMISSQILEGLSFMHENEFAHRDLKPSVCPQLHCSIDASNQIV